MDTNTITITNDDGTKVEMEILFTFSNDEYGKDYVVFVNPDNEDEVFCASYTDEELFFIDDEEELAMINEVLLAFDNEGVEDGQSKEKKA